MVLLFEREGDHLRPGFAEHQELEEHALVRQVVLGAALEHAAVAEAVALRDDAHALQVHLTDEGRERPERRQRPLAGVDHVSEVEERIQARTADPPQQLGDLEALQLLVLLEVEMQVVRVGQRREVAEVGLDQLHDCGEHALVARIDPDVAGADRARDGDDAVDVLPARGADLEMQGEAQGLRLLPEGAKLGGRSCGRGCSPRRRGRAGKGPAARGGRRSRAGRPASSGRG